VVTWKGKDKALQCGKVIIGRPDEFSEDDIPPAKGDLAHAITVFQCGTHAPKGAASDVLQFIQAPVVSREPVVDENWQMT
jgi:hypothetical protein